MAHWAEIDESNIVIRVVVTDNNDPNGDEGYQWLLDNLGGTWVKTSYNESIRKNYAGAGYSYDPEKDCFMMPQPFPSWTLNDETCSWEAPVPMPTDGDKLFLWDEPTLSWREVRPPSTNDIPKDSELPGSAYDWDEETKTWVKLYDLPE